MMTTSLDDKLVPKALTLVNKFGKDVVFVVLETEEYDPETGKVTEGGETSETQKVSPPAKYDRRYINDDTIQEGDTIIGLPAKNLTFTPKNGMVVKFDDTTWRIVSMNPLYTGELIALYELQLRQ